MSSEVRGVEVNSPPWKFASFHSSRKLASPTNTGGRIRSHSIMRVPTVKAAGLRMSPTSPTR